MTTGASRSRANLAQRCGAGAATRGIRVYSESDFGTNIDDPENTFLTARSECMRERAGALPSCLHRIITR